jgi:hypothetical protein
VAVEVATGGAGSCPSLPAGRRRGVCRQPPRRR